MTIPTMPDCAREICINVANKNGLMLDELFRKTRVPRISHARWEAFAALRNRDWSYPRIAKLWGYDHTTVLWGVRQFNKINPPPPTDGASYAPNYFVGG